MEFLAKFFDKKVITAAVTFAASLLAIWGVSMTPETQTLVVTLISSIGTVLITAMHASDTKKAVAADKSAK